MSVDLSKCKYGDLLVLRNNTVAIYLSECPWAGENMHVAYCSYRKRPVMYQGNGGLPNEFGSSWEIEGVLETGKEGAK